MIPAREDGLTEDLSQLFPFVPIAVALGVAGGLSPAFFTLPTVLRSYVQHFAAGLLMAIIAVDLLPEVREYGEYGAALIGFALGGAVMVSMEFGIDVLEKVRDENLPVGMAVAAGLDTTIDGLIIGTGFAVDPTLGALLAVGLGVELFSLNTAVSSEFRNSGASRVMTIATTSGIAFMLVLGAVGGVLLLDGRADAVFALVLSFAAAALLYLVTEELLVKGHAAANTATTSAVFFLGFLALMAFTLWVDA
jgi:zinc transporter, ZIP family